MEDNVKLFKQRMDANLSYKLELINYIPKDSKNILDIGCGTGSLTKEIRRARPNARIYALEANPGMLASAMLNEAADYFLEDLDAIRYGYFDVIVFSSVLHEIDNTFLFLKDMKKFLTPNGRFVIRDGLAAESEVVEEVCLRNPNEAKDFYEKCGEDSLIGRMPLTFKKGNIIGKSNDVRNLLQTYTWGFESLYREKDETFIRWSGSDYNELGRKLGFPRSFVWKATQTDYFKHLEKIVDLKGRTWQTHAYVIYLMEG